MQMKRTLIALLAAVAVAILGSLPCLANVIHVNTSTGNDVNSGLSWAAAVKTIQAGIGKAVWATSDEVWVAHGTYAERITLRDSIPVYGGFAGNETSRASRDLASNISIIEGGKSGNVVTMPASITGYARIDGFTIQNGHAYTNGGCGGGVNCLASSAYIENNVIQDNVADSSGGGIYSTSSAVTISNNTIARNEARASASSTVGGGGIYIAGKYQVNNSAVISDNHLADNKALHGNGGGVYIGSDCSSATVSENTFSGNTANESTGGGIWTKATQSTISDCAFSANYANRGGGIRVEASTTITRNTLTGNQAYDGGAGIDVRADSPMIASNLLYANTLTSTGTSTYGGGIYCWSSTPSIINNTIVLNSASYGGGVFCGATSGSYSPVIANNIISSNSSGICKSGVVTPVLRCNCVYANPPTGPLFNQYNYTGELTLGSTDISQEPLFRDAPAGNYRLLSSSPCMDTGSDSDVLSGWLDLDLNARKQGLHVDMGAYEIPTQNYSTTGGFVKRGAWNLISVPADPVNDDPLSVFAGVDVPNASFQFWKNAADPGGYQLYGETFGWAGPVVRGTPYWLIETGLGPNKDLSYEGIVPVDDFVMTIPAHSAAPYWIMFGTPFPSTVPASDISFSADGGTTWRSWANAYSDRIVDSNAQGYDSASQSFITITPPEIPGYDHQMLPWWGYWLLVESADEVRIRFTAP